MRCYTAMKYENLRKTEEQPQSKSLWRSQKKPKQKQKHTQKNTRAYIRYTERSLSKSILPKKKEEFDEIKSNQLGKIHKKGLTNRQ